MTAGKKIGGALVNLDLTGCWWPDCFLCQCEATGGGKGGSHTRAGATYNTAVIILNGKWHVGAVPKAQTRHAIPET